MHRHGVPDRLCGHSPARVDARFPPPSRVLWLLFHNYNYCDLSCRCYSARYWHEQEFATVEALRGFAREADMSMATLAVAWVLSNPAITAPIVGASRPEQLADSVAAAEKDGLPADLKARLDELTHGWRLVDADR
jgi:diketogulonate reductase-like aldo/keto reductase